MNFAHLSIKRPVFITCVIILMIAVGLVSMRRMGVDLFPDVTFPVVTVTTTYEGAGPQEIETLVTKPMEEELGTLSGIKRLSSTSQEGVSVVVCEFTLETDVKYAEQQVRDRIGSVKRKLPTDAKEPIIRRIDPADQPIVTLAVESSIPAAELFDLANEEIKPQLEQVNQVGLVNVLGGRKKEIQVILDRNKLKARELSVTGIASRLKATGQDIPAGKLDVGGKETVFRALGQFSTLDDIRKQVVSFIGSDVAIKVSDVGEVFESLEDEKARVFTNGNQSIYLQVYRQSGANTVAVVNAVLAKVQKINNDLKVQGTKAEVKMIRDGAKPIRANIDDVKESIFIGILLAVIVVYFFLANGRSTVITGLALPNSLIGAFILMAAAGFTINIMSLLALSLAVGLLVDDAIVVRENIFRHIEMGKSPKRAALEGTMEVSLAVVAVTLTVLAVFGPVGFLKGVVGQFFKQFGLTVCFAMAISLFDALTIAPMLSAYLAGKAHAIPTEGLYGKTLGRMLRGFDRFQARLEDGYSAVIRFTLRRPILVLSVSFAIFAFSIFCTRFITKTFLPAQDTGEFTMSLELPPGTTLDKMAEVSLKVDELLRKNMEVDISALTVGNKDGDSNQAEFYVRLIERKLRKVNTGQFKDRLREQLKEFAFANPKVKDFDAVGGGQRPFTVNILGLDQKQLEEYSNRALKIAGESKGLQEVDSNFRSGKPEFQAIVDNEKADRLGVSSALLGNELRYQIAGATPAVFRQVGREYNIRVRFKEDQRNLQAGFPVTFVPNINNNLVRVADVTKPVATVGPMKITRQDRGRYIQISADIATGGGLGDVVAELTKRFDTELKLPPGMRYQFVGQAENFAELVESIITAMGLGILFIFLVLSSLYESFVTPFTIMLALPLAVCGAFFALAITGQSLNIFSMIGVVMLLGIATKNSILLVDFANTLLKQGKSREEAILLAGRTRLRPILMTTMALIAGMIPIAIGLNEASKQRTSMGVALIGGLISSTLLTLVVIPASYQFIDRFRVWSLNWMKRIFMANHGEMSEKEDATWDEAATEGKPIISKASHGHNHGHSSDKGDLSI